MRATHTCTFLWQAKPDRLFELTGQGDNQFVGESELAGFAKAIRDLLVAADPEITLIHLLHDLVCMHQ